MKRKRFIDENQAYIDAAEYSVSEQHNKTKGIEFYNKAIF